MLIRIVRMYFIDERAEDFVVIFHTHKMAIRNFPGCSYLHLLKDAKDPNCYTTISHWDKPESLEAYRQSELFGKVWSKVKPLLKERTLAFSLTHFVEVL
ncbi:MAG: putative quinol monooxygenase [Flammeovirgaceae bacterium]